VIDDKLQGSVATYLKSGGVVNNQIKKGLLLTLSGEYLESYKQESGCLVHFVHVATTLLLLGQLSLASLRGRLIEYQLRLG